MSKLPNAPLAEVVFELRWKLSGPKELPSEVKQDPGYGVLVNGFLADASKKGFKKHNKVNPPQFPLLGHNVDIRLTRTDKTPFPLWQIGPGIFASNESEDYEWSEFKKMSLDGLEVVLDNYPKAKNLSLVPSHLELRYIDMFDLSYLESKKNINLLTFIQKWTNLSVDFDKSVKSGISSGSPEGRINLVYSLPKLKHSKFIIDIGSARNDNREDVIRLETRILASSDELGFPKTKDPILKKSDEWMEKAHTELKHFFRQFITKDLWEKFNESN